MNGDNLACNQSSQKLCVSMVPIFNHLDHQEQAELTRTSRIKTYAESEMIFQAGKPSGYLVTLVCHDSHFVYDWSETST
ncbi:hypothetical protein GCM10008983_04050 [Lentibacillus halophilus]|uniref:Uncharacterized protein n=1 Tax=Lentibacillus halophilus TaxID=295065 RepID=A0ABN0Z3V3_9BACI